MNIIIIGATSVGIELAEYLVSGGHAVTLVDNPSEDLSQISNRLDLRVVQGVPSWPSILRMAGAENAELLVATTPEDEMNIAACSIASSLFRVPRKIARIRAPDYLVEADEIFGSHAIPIDHVISPEHITSQVILDLLELPGTTAVGSFCNDRIVIASTRCAAGGKLIGKPMSHLHELEPRAKVMAVYRDQDLVKDLEKEVFTPYDIVFFCCERARALSVLSALIPLEPMGKFISIAGGSHTADELARLLSTKYKVKLIETDKQRAEKTANRLHNTAVEIFCSDPCNPDFIAEEHIDKSDRFIAADLSDEANIISALMLSRRNKVKTIAIIRNENFHTLAKGPEREIDIIISPKEAIISAILSDVRQEGVERMRLFRQGLSEGIELTIQGNKITSRLVGRTINDITLPQGVTFGLAMRGKVIHVIDKDFKFEDGDKVVAYLHDHNQMRQLVKLVRPRSFWIPKW